MVLLALWSPKGGSGTSVFAAGCALVAARRGPTRLADFDGDQPAILGLAQEPEVGLADWLSAGPDTPAESLERIAVGVAPGLVLVGRGAPPRVSGPPALPEAGAALAVSLAAGARATVLDAGRATTAAERAAVESADARLVVVRGCYLTLRRAVADPLVRDADGVVLVEEPGRTLGATETAEVLGIPVVARVPWRAAVARAVDAGVLAARVPDALARPAQAAWRAVGLELPLRGVA